LGEFFIAYSIVLTFGPFQRFQLFDALLIEGLALGILLILEELCFHLHQSSQALERFRVARLLPVRESLPLEPLQILRILAQSLFEQMYLEEFFAVPVLGNILKTSDHLL
jgi:hypothetical protein